jgi:hypothetical protein
MNLLEALLSFRKQHVQGFLRENNDILKLDSYFSDNLSVGTNNISDITF